MKRNERNQKRGTILLMIVGLLAMLFMIVTAYITLARFDRLTLMAAGEGAQAEQALDSVNDMIAAAIAQSWNDDQGALKIGGENYVDIPGSGPTQWLAANMAVRNFDPPDIDDSDYGPEAYAYPGVSSLTGTTGNKSLTELMFDRPDDRDISDDSVTIGWNSRDDTVYNARRSFMDADGDGIADSFFGDGSASSAGVAIATELANTMAGLTVRTRDVNPGSIDDVDEVRRWEHFNEQARYLAAARVISHGGMLQVGLPLDDGDAWNREFVQGMFRWLHHSDDRETMPTHYQLSGAWEQRAQIEPLLRVRGGLLIGQRGTADDSIPTWLASLQRDFDNTFIPQYGARGNWQRFNLADENDWATWHYASSFDANLYNDQGGPSGEPQRSYIRRQIMTTMNSSDELARDQSDDLPSYGPSPSYPLLEPGVYPGQLKYYLGRISHAFDDVTREFVYSSDAEYDGYEVIRDLVAYYNEMLSGYDWPTSGGGSSYEAVKRIEQAHMLAVNTVAFAARYLAGNEGRLPTVYAFDKYGQKYCGYVPQPFITEAMVYADYTDPNDPNDPNAVGTFTLSLAVELYNPHDARDAAQAERRGINLRQYAITINDPNAPIGNPEVSPPGAWLGLLGDGDGEEYMEGRSFALFAAHADTGQVEFFELKEAGGVLQATLRDPFIPWVVSVPASKKINVRLWRTGGGGEDWWYLVDKMELDVDEFEESSKTWYAQMLRDTSYEEHLGAQAGYGARWRMTTAFPPDPNGPDANMSGGEVLVPIDPNDPNDPANEILLTVGRGALESSIEVSQVNPSQLGPCTPLYTMNAGLHLNTEVHGTRRPASFPTVGFLMFVPRFSHMRNAALPAEWTPMSETLYDQWKIPARKPALADFGHMPIFDNRQKDAVGSSGFSDTGQVPWGLLVFDYFTTLNPNDANGDGIEGDALDPYRVSGRININTAPWHVLAALPVIGPLNGHSGNLPLSLEASPAFWSYDSGVLTGVGYDPVIVRFAGEDIDNRVGPLYQEGWWRLGSNLAQAAASYRDRVQYTDNAPAMMADAYWRNSLVGGARYRPVDYGLRDPNSPAIPDGGIRGELDAPNHPDAKRGFLSIGELANVMGFDSSNRTQLDDAMMYGPVYTVLGGDGHDVAHGDFFKAASLLALLDTQFLTTRSNTFTIYVTLAVNDAEGGDSQASIRSQITVDRSNLLPRLVMWDPDEDGIDEPMLQLMDTDDDGVAELGPVIIRNTGLPEVVARREVAYFNAAHDD